MILRRFHFNMNINIITWEWFIIIGLIVGGLGVLTFCIIDTMTSLVTLPAVGVSISAIILLSALLFNIPLLMAQNKVEKEYAKYIETKAKYYEALLTEDPLDDYAMELEVQKYNVWYSDNKGKLENKWHLWGTSSYANKFDYIEVVK